MKIINVLLIIILVLGAILGIKIYNSKNPSEVSKDEKYSIQDIQKILDKANDIKNYECKINNVYSHINTYKRKDNKICLTVFENSVEYIDYDYNVSYYCTVNENGKYYIERKPSTDYIITSNSYTGITGNEISISETTNIDAKKVRYNGIECLKFVVKDTEFQMTYWININNGLVMKTEDTKGYKYEYTYKFNTVTDTDVNPDLTEYKKLN